MPGPAPTYQPQFTGEQFAVCQGGICQHRALQAQVCRAELALLLHGTPALDNVSAGDQVGKHENWVRYLADKPGRVRKPAFPSAAGRHRQGDRLRAERGTGRRNACTDTL